MAAAKKTDSRPAPRPGTRSQPDAKATNVHVLPSAVVLVDGGDWGGDELWLVENTRKKPKRLERRMADAVDALAADGTKVHGAKIELSDLADGRTFDLVNVRPGGVPVLVFDHTPSDEMLGTGALPEVGRTYVVTPPTQPAPPTGDADDADLHPYATWYLDGVVPEPLPDTEEEAAEVDP